jgi:dihydroorotate dehydrogenase/NAD-dependent dihydropyrimidine dehydrogenase PreA subunit
MADLKTEVNGIIFPNPVMPAAGPNVRTGELMLAAAAGGAGGIVSKTVSVNAASDPRPTIRRYGAKGIINSETWSEIPIESYLRHLHTARSSGRPLIVSIGYQPDEVSRLGKLIEKEVQPDAFEFSTHYTGKSTEPIVEVARSLRRSVSCPIWIKLSPNFPDLEELAKQVSPYVDAFVAVNSYGPVLDFDPVSLEPLLGSSYGWLSGSPLFPIALGIVYRLSAALDKPVIGVGGVSNAEEALKFIMAGASLVQICSAAIREGSAVYGRIAQGMSEWMDLQGYSSLNAIHRLYHKKHAGRKALSGLSVMSIDDSLCTGCGACIKRCIHGALFLSEQKLPAAAASGKKAAASGKKIPEADRKARVRPDNCIGCGFCQDFCPEHAMRLEDKSVEQI